MLGTGAGVSLGSVGQSVAAPSGTVAGDDDLRLFREAAISETHETDVQGNYAYVATGTKGMSVVDRQNPGQPEVITEVDLAADIEVNFGLKAPVIEIFRR